MQTTHNFKEIRNKQDEKNYFRLQEYEDERSYLTDGEEIITVGYLEVEHPRIKGLRIAQLRSSMWVKR